MSVNNSSCLPGLPNFSNFDSKFWISKKERKKIASICKAVQYSIILELLFIYRKKHKENLSLYVSWCACTQNVHGWPAVADQNLIYYYCKSKAILMWWLLPVQGLPTHTHTIIILNSFFLVSDNIVLYEAVYLTWILDNNVDLPRLTVN